jgi:transcriptional regulator GlxA family with amidase domain
MPSIPYATIVRRALDMMTRHSGEPLAVVDLCCAAGVCERTLRNAFHRVHGVSPKQYLIRYRLEAAHEALLCAGGERGAVTRVATDYGFLELGRFAGAYRDLFGVRPSDTLRATLRTAQP